MSPARSGGRGAADRTVVPPARFGSYYGRPVVRPSPWEADIPAYLFTGGLAAGSSLLAAGADLTGRPALRRLGRLAAASSLGVSMVALVHDLGRPTRFVNMLRTVKLTSPMSIGSWILALYGPFAGTAAAAEVAGALPPRLGEIGLLRLMERLGRPAGLVAGLTAPPVAAYTAVLLADTATPAWHEAHRELPFVFTASAAAASGGLAVLAVPPGQSGPARRLAVGGAVVELVSESRMERSMGLAAEALHIGRAGRLMRASRALTLAGAAATMLSRRSRVAGVLGGAALLAGSACTRFAIFEAGQASAADPRYTVVPQRQRLDGRSPAAPASPAGPPVR